MEEIIRVADIIGRKGPEVVTIGVDATVLEAAKVMNEHRIGSVVVSHEGRIAGIFSERDVLERVVGQERDPATTRVNEVMTTEVFCCRPETSLEEARSVCTQRRIRHLPVSGQEDELLGLVSIGDLNAQQSQVQETTIHVLRWYLYQTY